MFRLRHQSKLAIRLPDHQREKFLTKSGRQDTQVEADQEKVLIDLIPESEESLQHLHMNLFLRHRGAQPLHVRNLVCRIHFPHLDWIHVVKSHLI